MKPFTDIATILLLIVALAGCSEPTPEPVNLLPPEVFTWTGDQPISFSPPPEDWKRSRYQNGGTEGVSFILAGGKGQMVFVAERFFLGNRDRCAAIRKLTEGLEGYNSRTFAKALQQGKRFENSAPTAQDDKVTPIINATLGRAMDLYRAGDMALVQVELGRALEASGSIRYTLAETVDQVLFTAKGNSVFRNLQVDAPVDGELAGTPSATVNFTFDSRGVLFLGRRIYLVHNNRMFEIGFQGLPENLPMFEAILNSMTFPQGPCEH